MLSDVKTRSWALFKYHVLIASSLLIYMPCIFIENVHRRVANHRRYRTETHMKILYSHCNIRQFEQTQVNVKSSFCRYGIYPTNMKYA